MNKVTVITVLTMVLGMSCSSPTERPSTTKTSEGDKSQAPSGERAAQNDRALVRFVNADPTLDKANVMFGDQSAFSGVAYRSVTPYQQLPSERREFKLSGAGAGNALATNSEGLTAGRHYTLVAMRGTDNRTTLMAFGEPMDRPDSGKAKVRMINATNEGDLELRVAGSKDRIWDGVKFGNGTDYKEVNAGPTVLEIWNDDRKTRARRVESRTLEAGKFYTVIALGDGKQDSLLIEDSLM